MAIYTPPGNPPASGPYPLLMLFDGPAYLGNLGAPNTLDNLTAAGRIRPTVACFVSGSRSVLPNSDRMPTYAAAIATELVPWIRSSYAVTTNPRDVVIGGFSAGGGSAGVIALKHPDVFGNVLSQSGGQQVLVPLYIDMPNVPVRVYIDMGLYETYTSLPPDERAIDGWPTDDLPSSGANGLQRMRLLRAILRAKGYDVTYRETGGAHQAVHWRATLAEGLILLLGPATR